MGKIEKKNIMAAVVIMVAIAGAFLFVGMTNSFQKKIDYLSDRYPTFKCRYSFEDYTELIMGLDPGDLIIRFEFIETNSWTTFKSFLMEARIDETLVDNVFYDPQMRVIWFMVIENEGIMRCSETFYFIRG